MRRGSLGWLEAAAVALAGLVLLPLLAVFSGWLQFGGPSGEVWRHLADTLLAELLLNTLWLLLGVGALVTLLGTGLAWLTASCEFPGRRLFDWALMLPLAVPAYVLAFVAVGLLDFIGPVQGLLREVFGRDGYWFPQVRSTGGVITVLGLVLYPYVYMLARASFLSQSDSAVEAARSLGLGPWAAFLRVSLPTARPAIVGGLSLALMETLADFGAVAVFNYDTFTTAIYKSWFGLFSLAAASQLASLLLLFAVMALTLERGLRGRARYHETARVPRRRRHLLQGWRGWLATAAAAAVLGAAFVIPVGQLLLWAWQSAAEDLNSRYWGLLRRTLGFGGMAAGLTVAGALLLAFARRRGAVIVRAAVRTATLGYALPGSVLAVGVVLTFSGFDRVLAGAGGVFGLDWGGRFLSGTAAALLMAYMVRFLAVAYAPIDSGLGRLRASLGEAAHGLGAGGGAVLRRVYLPLLRPGLLTAGLLVLVDVMKEMPATLLLRPFGWDTLAVRIYEMTSEGEWQRAALPALTLILAGLLPVVVLVRRSAAAAWTQPVAVPAAVDSAARGGA